MAHSSTKKVHYQPQTHASDHDTLHNALQWHKHTQLRAELECVRVWAHMINKPDKIGHKWEMMPLSAVSAELVRQGGIRDE